MTPRNVTGVKAKRSRYKLRCVIVLQHLVFYFHLDEQNKINKRHVLLPDI